MESSPTVQPPDQRTASVQSRSPAPTAPTAPVILVVDDNESVRKVLEIGLQVYGFEVWSAASGPEALTLFSEKGEAVAAVLLDVLMPEMDGPATLAEIQKLDPGIPVCFISGYLGGFDAEDLRRCGARYVFSKPFDIKVLASVLASMTRTTPT